MKTFKRDGAISKEGCWLSLSLRPEISHEWGQGFKTNAKRDRPRHEEVYSVNKHSGHGLAERR